MVKGNGAKRGGAAPLGEGLTTGGGAVRSYAHLDIIGFKAGMSTGKNDKNLQVRSGHRPPQRLNWHGWFMKGWSAWVEEVVALSGRRVADRDRRVACATSRFTFIGIICASNLTGENLVLY